MRCFDVVVDDDGGGGIGGCSDDGYGGRFTKLSEAIFDIKYIFHQVLDIVATK